MGADLAHLIMCSPAAAIGDIPRPFDPIFSCLTIRIHHPKLAHFPGQFRGTLSNMFCNLFDSIKMGDKEHFPSRLDQFWLTAFGWPKNGTQALPFGQRQCRAWLGTSTCCRPNWQTTLASNAVGLWSMAPGFGHFPEYHKKVPLHKMLDPPFLQLVPNIPLASPRKPLIAQSF